LLVTLAKAISRDMGYQSKVRLKAALKLLEWEVEGQLKLSL
jgi:hypothetical protein